MSAKQCSPVEPHSAKLKVDLRILRPVLHSGLSDGNLALRQG